MSVSGIFSSSLANNPINSHYQMSNSEFQQLGQDLANGNLPSAQSDFAILQQAFMPPASSASTSPASGASTSNPLVQAFQQLSSDLKTGDLTAAQKDYSTIQQDMKSEFSGHMHHHHVGGFNLLNMLNPSSQDGSSTGTQSSTNTTQQTYATLAQQLQQYALNVTRDAGAGAITALTNPISLMA